MDKIHLAFEVEAATAFSVCFFDKEIVCRTSMVEPGALVREGFEFGEAYHVRVEGPNGLVREFRGKASDPGIAVMVDRTQIRLSNGSAASQTFQIVDESGGRKPLWRKVASGYHATVLIDAVGTTLRCGAAIWRTGTREGADLADGCVEGRERLTQGKPCRYKGRG